MNDERGAGAKGGCLGTKRIERALRAQDIQLLIGICMT